MVNIFPTTIHLASSKIMSSTSHCPLLYKCLILRVKGWLPPQHFNRSWCVMSTRPWTRVISPGSYVFVTGHGHFSVCLLGFPHSLHWGQITFITELTMWLLFKNNARKLGSSETELWHSLHGLRCSGALTYCFPNFQPHFSVSLFLPLSLNALTPTP